MNDIKNSLTTLFFDNEEANQQIAELQMPHHNLNDKDMIATDFAKGKARQFRQHKIKQLANGRISSKYNDNIEENLLILTRFSALKDDETLCTEIQEVKKDFQRMNHIYRTIFDKINLNQLISNIKLIEEFKELALDKYAEYNQYQSKIFAGNEEALTPYYVSDSGHDQLIEEFDSLIYLLYTEIGINQGIKEEELFTIEENQEEATTGGTLFYYQDVSFPWANKNEAICIDTALEDFPHLCTMFAGSKEKFIRNLRSI